MDFRILGPFEVAGAGGVVDLRGAKRRGLLACLVVHAGQPMSTDRLVEELWGEGGSAAAARTVQTYVSQLRKHEGPGQSSDQGLAGSREGAWVVATSVAAVVLGGAVTLAAFI
jgi:DNA-binding SARP family transcriptional activator